MAMPELVLTEARYIHDDALSAHSRTSFVHVKVAAEEQADLFVFPGLLLQCNYFGRLQELEVQRFGDNHLICKQKGCGLVDVIIAIVQAAAALSCDKRSFCSCLLKNFAPLRTGRTRS